MRHFSAAEAGAQLPDVRLHRDVDGRVFGRPVYGADPDVVAPRLPRVLAPPALLRPLLRPPIHPLAPCPLMSRAGGSPLTSSIMTSDVTMR